MDDPDLDALLDSTLNEFNHELPVSICWCVVIIHLKLSIPFCIFLQFQGNRVAIIQASKDVDESSHTDPTNQERGKYQQSKESLQAEVCAKFTALMTIFTSDVKLEDEYLKEFQVSASVCSNSIEHTK